MTQLCGQAGIFVIHSFFRTQITFVVNTKRHQIRTLEIDPASPEEKKEWASHALQATKIAVRKHLENIATKIGANASFIAHSFDSMVNSHSGGLHCIAKVFERDLVTLE